MDESNYKPHWVFKNEKRQKGVNYKPLYASDQVAHEKLKEQGYTDDFHPFELDVKVNVNSREYFDHIVTMDGMYPKNRYTKNSENISGEFSTTGRMTSEDAKKIFTSMTSGIEKN